MIYTTLFLLTLFIFQKINFLYTSLGFIILVLMFLYSIFYLGLAKKNVTIKKESGIYILFIFSFIYNIPFFIDDIDLTKILVIVFPLLSWYILSVVDLIKLKYILNSKILYIMLLFIGGILLIDFYIMFTSNSIIKKNFLFANPNYTAYVILVLEALFLFTNKYKVNKEYLFIFIASFLIIFTLSKTAYVMQIIIILSILNKKILKKVIIMAFLIFLSSLVFLKGINFDILESMKYFFERTIDSAIGHRIDLIKSAVEIFSDNPIFGCGYSQYQDIAFLQYNSGLNVKTHNILLTLLSENGIVGMVLFLTSIFLIVFYIFKYKFFIKEKMILLLIFTSYSLSHAGVQFFSFTPLILYILTNDIHTNLRILNVKKYN